MCVRETQRERRVGEPMKEAAWGHRGGKRLMEGPEWKRKEGPLCPRGGVGQTLPGDSERGEAPGF